MSTSPATMRFWWKEFHQLLPLMIVLPTLALIMLAMLSNYTGPGGPMPLNLIAMMPPVLFACGVGAILVCQEKETQSLTWLRSLPFSPGHWVTHLYVVALTGLAVLWLAAFLILAFIANSPVGIATPFAPLADSSLMLTIVNSIYLLCCGILTGWIGRSALVSLLAIVPLAVLPAIADLAYVRITTIGQGSTAYMLAETPTIVSYVNLLIGIVATAIAGYYAAMRELSGVNAPESLLSWPSKILGSVATWPRRLRGESVLRNAPLASSSTLIWQFFHQHFVAIVGLVALVVLSVPLASHTIRHDLLNLRPPAGPTKLLGGPSFIVWACSLCWAALLTFHGEHARSGVRFLAERGLKPKQIWISRQIIPLGFLASYIVMFSVMTRIGIYRSWGDSPSDHVEAYSIVLGIVIAYCVSQWISQLIRPVLIAAIVAPVASALAIGAAWYERVHFDASLPWLFLQFAVIPIVATYTMTTRWMNGDRTSGMWLRQVGWMAACIYCGVASASLTYKLNSRLPGFIPSKLSSIDVPARQRLLDAASQYPIETSEPTHRSFQHDYESGDENVAAKTVQEKHQALLDAMGKPQRDKQFELLNAWLQDGEQALSASPWFYGVLMFVIENLRGDLEPTLKTSEPPADSLVQEYRHWMQLGTRIVAGLRRSPRLADHDVADTIEILWLRELVRPGALDWLDQATFDAVAAPLRDDQARWSARRRALLMTYRTRNQTRGSVQPAFAGSYPTERIDWTNHLEEFTTTLLQYIDSISSPGRDEGQFPAAKMVELTGSVPERYGIGPSGMFYRIDDAGKFSATIGPNLVYPATQWGAGWEAQAKNLKAYGVKP